MCKARTRPVRNFEVSVRSLPFVVPLVNTINTNTETQLRSQRLRRPRCIPRIGIRMVLTLV